MHHPLISFYYCPQRSCGKVMFLHLSVSHSVHGEGVCHTPWQTPPGQTHPRQTHPLPSACWNTHPLPSACWDTHTPCPVHVGIHTHTPPSACRDTHTPPHPVHVGILPLRSASWDTVNKRVVRIPLECIPVYLKLFTTQVSFDYAI